MRPLLYLSLKSVVNGIKRATTSPRRMIGLLFVVGYYFMVFIRPTGFSRAEDLPTFISFDLPPLQMIRAFVFAGFAVLTIFIALTTSSIQRLSFRPADVDVLFATPLNPRLVLLFRLFRDYLIALFFPLLFLLIGWRPTSAGLTALIRNLPDPHAAGYVFRTIGLAWILITLVWVAIGYALSLFINRSDLISDRNRQVISYSGGALFLGLAAYIALRISQSRGAGLQGFLDVTNDPLLHWVFFTASAGATMVMAPLQGNWTPFFGAVAFLLLLSGAAVAVAMTQVGYMYDQAAARGFDSLKLRKLQQRGDLLAVAEERARSGKMRARSLPWMDRVRLRGAAAILWRDVLIQMRATPLMIILFAGIGIVFGVAPAFSGMPDSTADGIMFLTMQGFSVFMGSMVIGQSGFIEVLRRVDFEKPLPFPPATISFYEVAAKAMPATLSVYLASIVCVCLSPHLWVFCLAAVLGLPLTSVLVCSVVFLVTVLFPDVDDPTQRGFRGLMILLGLCVVLLPVGIVGLGSTFLLKDVTGGLAIAAVLAGASALGISVLVSLLSGSLYAQFNPSE